MADQLPGTVNADRPHVIQGVAFWSLLTTRWAEVIILLAFADRKPDVLLGGAVTNAAADNTPRSVTVVATLDKVLIFLIVFHGRHALFLAV